MNAQPHIINSKAFPGTVLQSSDVDDSARTIALENLETPVCYLELNEIRRDGGTQPRAAIDLKHIKLLESQMEDGQELDEIVVFYDGTDHWLADGYHRWHAHHNQDKEAIACVIYQGSRRDAVLYSVGANAEHKPALPRSREDKRRAVMTLLSDVEWGKWSDSQIARQCRVNQSTVCRIRTSLMQCISETQERTYTTKHGTVAKMKTGNIGKNAMPPQSLTLSDRVIVTADHPLFPNSSGTIAQLPNPENAIVEFDTGERELINLKHLTPAIAPQLDLHDGGLVQINARDNKRIDGRKGRIATVGESTVEVWVRDVDRMTMHQYTVKHHQVQPLPLEEEPQLLEVCDRTNRLRQFSLDPFEVEILNLLERPVALTPVELEYLIAIEQGYENAQ